MAWNAHLTRLKRRIRSLRGPLVHPTLHAQVHALGHLAAPFLRGLVAGLPRRPSWAADQALRWLGELGTRAALEGLVEALWDESRELEDDAHDALEAHGARAVPLLLAAVDARPEYVAPTLAACGADTVDARVAAKLRELVARDLGLGAHCVWQFGDPRLVDDLMLALDRTDPVRDPRLAPGIVDAIDTVISFGVDPGPLGRRRLRQVAIVTGRSGTGAGPGL